MISTNPLENCIIAIRADLTNYVTHNDEREVENNRCCLFRMHLAGHDSNLAANKKRLANDIIYTLDQIRLADQTTRARFAQYDPRDAANLAYDALCKGFYRIQNCLEASMKQLDDWNRNKLRNGVLGEALQRSMITYQREWHNAKEAIWSNEDLHGPEGKFQYDTFNKEAILATFDRDKNTYQGRFVAIMNEAVVAMQSGTLSPHYGNMPPYRIKV
jgi:hypothetical protein